MGDHTARPRRDVPRREILRGLAAAGAAGAAVPVVLVAEAAPTDSARLDSLSWLTGIELTPADRELMSEDVAEQLASFAALRSVALGNAVPPAFHFDPRPGRSACTALDAGRPWRRTVVPAARSRPADDELAYAGIAELGAWLREGEVRAVELARPGGGGRRRPGAVRDRHRNLGKHRVAVLAVRDDRDPTDVRARAAHRVHGAVVDHGQDRLDRPLGARCGHRTVGYRGARRSRRLGDHPRAAVGRIDRARSPARRVLSGAVRSRSWNERRRRCDEASARRVGGVRRVDSFGQRRSADPAGARRVAERAARAQLFPGVEYVRANRVRSLLMRDWEALFERIDVLVTPSLVGDVLLATNLTGHPCVVLPNGFRSIDGTPTSISFVGRLHGEPELVELAAAYQEATGFHLRRPPLIPPPPSGERP